MQIGIVGFGHVGNAMKKLFTDAAVYDKNKNVGTREAINECDIAFVCVPTPCVADGRCDTSAVEEVISWLTCKVIVIRSTVYVGFTDLMMEKYKKEIVFQPEYYGETTAHPFQNLSSRDWLTFGGNASGIKLAIKAYQSVINSNIRINQCSAKEAEIAKYMCNAFLATKVIFCNEMYDICQATGINYDIVREIWVSDPRIGLSHTFVYENDRGFGGSCFPKDVTAIISQFDENDVDVSLLRAVLSKNKDYRNRNSFNRQTS